jgi:hypothetical protein
VIYQLAVSGALIVAILLACSWLEWARTRPARADGPQRLRNLVAGTVGLTVVAFAQPATAYVVEIMTSIPTTHRDDEAQLRQAFESAIVDVLTHAIRFNPTVLTVRSVRIVGDRIYILLLVVDEDGEATMKRLRMDEPPAP